MGGIVVGVVIHDIGCQPEDVISEFLTAHLDATVPHGDEDIDPSKTSGQQPNKRPHASFDYPTGEAAQLPQDAGFLRHLSVLKLLGPAMEVYNSWLCARQGRIPWSGHGSLGGRGDAACRLADPSEPKRDAKGRTASASAVPGAVLGAVPGAVPGASGSGMPSKARPERMDWIELYDRRHDLRPKVVMVTGCRCSAPVPSPSLLRAMAGEGARPGDNLKHTLFGAIVTSPLMCCGVSASIVLSQPLGRSDQDQEEIVSLPPASRFLMSHGLTTLGPLLEVRREVQQVTATQRHSLRTEPHMVHMCRRGRGTV